MRYSLNFSLGRAFLSTLTFRKVYNSFLIRLSYYISRVSGSYVHWGRIESLSIEPTNLCNLKCPECPSGNNQMTRARLFLAESDFQKVINDSYKHLVYLQLYFQGEPFMHPKLSHFISYASQKRIFTSTSTNGHFLNKSNCEKLVQSGLHQLIVSIDGATQESYEAYRVGGSLSQVVKGVQTLQQVKRDKLSALPHIVIQFVVFSTNEQEINAIKDLARKLKVSDVRLKSAQIDDYKFGNKLMPKTHRFNRYTQQKDGLFELKRKHNFKCFRVWNGSVVGANNELLPCCFDKDARHSYGNSLDAELNSIWKNVEAKVFRKNVWNDYSKIDMCQNCTEGLKRTWFNR